MRTLLLILTFFPVVSFAEAGLPLGFCGQQTCACGASQCSCGQVCNANTQQCQAAQAYFCQRDQDCAATCDAFICEQNVCVRGLRTDGGTDGGGDTSPPPRGCGCSALPGLPLALALLMFRRRSCAGSTQEAKPT